MVRASKHAWAAVADLRAVDREALPGAHADIMLDEALRATEEPAMELEEAEVGAIEA